MGTNIQLDENGKLRHFLSIEGLDQTILTEILDTAESFTSVTDRTIKKVPILRGKTVANLFLKPAPAPAPLSNSPHSVYQLTF